MLARRLRRRPSINPALGQRIVFAGNVHYQQTDNCTTFYAVSESVLVEKNVILIIKNKRYNTSKNTTLL